MRGAAAQNAGWPDALRIDVPVAMSALPGFADGEVSVQDASAQAVAEALLPLPPGARVLDACAAPGGKTAHILERAGADLLAHQIARDLLLEMLYMVGHLGPRAD